MCILYASKPNVDFLIASDVHSKTVALNFGMGVKVKGEVTQPSANKDDARHICKSIPAKNQNSRRGKSEPKWSLHPPLTPPHPPLPLSPYVSCAITLLLPFDDVLLLLNAFV